jgi:hypothetical protein
MAELDGWAAQLPSATAPWHVTGPAAEAVANGIARSHEALQRLVASYYSFFLGRRADGTEELGWVESLKSGVPTEHVVAGILNSSEFAARANALEGTPDASTNYVGALYRLLLRRPAGIATSAEIQGWVLQFPARNRAAIAIDFLQSFEFRNNTVQTLYGATSPAALSFSPNLLKRRPPIAVSESQGWQNSALDVYRIEIAIAASLEYFFAAH